MDSQIIALSGMILTFIVGILNLFVIIRMNILGKYNDVISRTMNDWIRDLRLETGEFISIAIKLFYGQSRDPELFSELVKHGYVIRTHAGRKYSEYQEIVNTIIGIDYENNTLSEEDFKKYLLYLERYSMECFIDRWKHNQHATKGSIK